MRLVHLLNTAGVLGGRWTPLSLFANGEDGFCFNFSKTDRLFQDTIGQTAVSADGNPVGLAFEGRSWGSKTLAELIAAQPERIVNGDGNSAAGWTVNQANGTGTLTSVGGKLRLEITSGTFINAWQSFSTVVGRWYRVAGSYTEVVAAGFRGVRKSDSNPASSNIVNINTGTIGSSALKAGYFQATATTTYVHLQVNLNGVGSVVDFDDISLKEIPSYSGIQATTAARPFWKTGGFIRFDGVDDTLTTSAKPGAAGSIAIHGKVTSPSRALVSCGITNNDRAEMVSNAAGRLGGNAGLLNSNTLWGGPVILGVKGVNIMTWNNATGAVNLYRDGVSVYSGLYTGAVALTNPFIIGSRSGTQLYADMDLYQALTINRALSPDEALKLSNYWNAQ